MTFFRQPLSVCRNSDDIRVLLVGLLCTIIIFVVVSSANIDAVDLILTK